MSIFVMWLRRVPYHAHNEHLSSRRTPVVPRERSVSPPRVTRHPRQRSRRATAAPRKDLPSLATMRIVTMRIVSGHDDYYHDENSCTQQKKHTIERNSSRHDEN